MNENETEVYGFERSGCQEVVIAVTDNTFAFSLIPNADFFNLLTLSI
jgi:hypothetical protein